MPISCLLAKDHTPSFSTATSKSYSGHQSQNFSFVLARNRSKSSGRSIFGRMTLRKSLAVAVAYGPQISTAFCYAN
ncbi:MAG: hypothetical protein A2521_09815 [Deltaproteobacteria bacterium RIFOXYD12_FULL_57_12]|nr:MAG: hypothetical protein A2521_09815 [Deltaproteobacteria bacterium RIFOXYD12_FULL_57_12]